MDAEQKNIKEIHFLDLNWVSASFLSIFIVSIVELFYTGLDRVTFYSSVFLCVITLLTALYNLALGKRKVFSIVIITIWVVISILMVLSILLLIASSGHPISFSL